MSFLLYLCFQVSLVVNSAGEELRLHRGQASKALLEKAGKKLQAKCDEIAPKGIKFGEVVVTPGYELQSAFVVHGACCDWSAGETTCERVSVSIHKHHIIAISRDI